MAHSPLLLAGVVGIMVHTSTTYVGIVNSITGIFYYAAVRLAHSVPLHYAYALVYSCLLVCHWYFFLQTNSLVSKSAVLLVDVQSVLESIIVHWCL
jgi:hypothetical protein